MWLIRSEVDARGLTIEDYVNEVLTLPDGIDKAAILLEKLIWLQSIDMILMFTCFKKGYPVPPLFCVPDDAIKAMREIHTDSFNPLDYERWFDDHDSARGAGRWFSHFAPRKKLKYFLEAFNSLPICGGKQLLENLKSLSRTVREWEQPFIDQLFYEVDESDKNQFLDILSTLKQVTSQHAVHSSESFSDIISELQSSPIIELTDAVIKVPRIITELVSEEWLYQGKDGAFYPTTSLRDLFFNLQKKQRQRLTERIVMEFIKNPSSGKSYTQNSIRQYFKELPD